jgi:hypothetical protein
VLAVGIRQVGLLGLVLVHPEAIELGVAPSAHWIVVQRIGRAAFDDGGGELLGVPMDAKLAPPALVGEEHRHHLPAGGEGVVHEGWRHPLLPSRKEPPRGILKLVQEAERTLLYYEHNGTATDEDRQVIRRCNAALMRVAAWIGRARLLCKRRARQLRFITHRFVI